MDAVEKVVLQPGDGTRPAPPSHVQLQYTVATLEGAGLDMVGADHCPFSVPLGDGALPPALEEAVRGMQVGERCRLSGPSSRLLGAPPPGGPASVAVELRLLGTGPGPPLGPGGREAAAPTAEQRAVEWLAAAVDDRQLGNTFLKEGKLLDAKQCYCSSISRCVLLLRHGGGPLHDALDCLLSARCNLALCYLRLGRFRQCCRQCDKVLARQPDNVKALYRRAQAYGEQQEYTAALRDAEACLALDGGNADAAKLRARLQTAQRQRTAREQAQYRGLFAP